MQCNCDAEARMDLSIIGICKSEGLEKIVFPKGKKTCRFSHMYDILQRLVKGKVPVTGFGRFLLFAVLSSFIQILDFRLEVVL